MERKIWQGKQIEICLRTSYGKKTNSTQWIEEGQGGEERKDREQWLGRVRQGKRGKENQEREREEEKQRNELTRTLNRVWEEYWNRKTVIGPPKSRVGLLEQAMLV